MVKWLCLAVSLGCLRFVIVVFPDHTHLLFLNVLLSFFFYFRCTNYESIFPTFSQTAQCSLEATFTAFGITASTHHSQTYVATVDVCAGTCPTPVSKWLYLLNFIIGLFG